MIQIISLIISVFFLSLSPWKSIHWQRIYSVSGVAAFKDGFLVVHDNKKKNQPRVSFIDKKYQITPLVWPDPELPYDLESAYQFPNIENRYIFMESTGKCYEASVDPKDYRIDILHTYTLPKLKPKMNLEGIAIFPSGQGLVIIYGDRGSDSRKSTLFTALFNPKSKSFKEVKTLTFDLPQPKKDKRNIADLALKTDGSLWCSATSDPGDDGPFSTFIYELGQFSHAGVFTPTHPDLLKAIMAFDGQKVEAMIFQKDKLVLMTDNENFGSTMNTIKY